MNRQKEALIVEKKCRHKERVLRNSWWTEFPCSPFRALWRRRWIARIFVAGYAFARRKLFDYSQANGTVPNYRRSEKYFVKSSIYNAWSGPKKRFVRLCSQGPRKSMGIQAVRKTDGISHMSQNTVSQTGTTTDQPDPVWLKKLAILGMMRTKNWYFRSIKARKANVLSYQWILSRLSWIAVSIGSSSYIIYEIGHLVHEWSWRYMYWCTNNYTTKSKVYLSWRIPPSYGVQGHIWALRNDFWGNCAN